MSRGYRRETGITEWDQVMKDWPQMALDMKLIERVSEIGLINAASSKEIEAALEKAKEIEAALEKAKEIDNYEKEKMALGEEIMSKVKEKKEDMAEQFDNVNKPKHYNREGGMQCIEEMELIFGREAVKTFCKLNAWKYRYRAADKNGEEDLRKSDWYLNKYKELSESSITVMPTDKTWISGYNLYQE